MDELELLREMRKDIPIAKDAMVDGGRERVLQRIFPGTKKKARRRTKAIRITVGSVATLGLATAVVVTNVVGLASWRGASTAQVLNNAAEMTIKTSEPVVNPGQYLKIDSTNLWMSTCRMQDPSGALGVNINVEWLDTEKASLYIPANRDQEWVWERSGRIPTTFFSDEAKVEHFMVRPAPFLPKRNSLATPGIRACCSTVSTSGRAARDSRSMERHWSTSPTFCGLV